MISVMIMETCGLIFYIIFFITVMLYLYFSSNIIIKNIIYLFLDFSEEKYNKNKGSNNMIILKLIAFQSIIDDFNIDCLEKYSKKLDSLNKNKLVYSNNKEEITIFNIDIDNSKNIEAIKSTVNADNNNNSKKRSSINKIENKNINMNNYEKTSNDSSLKGNILFERNYLNIDVFYNTRLMENAYYGYKKPLYLDNKDIVYSTTRSMLCDFLVKLQLYEVTHILAYNLPFDLNALNKTSFHFVGKEFNLNDYMHVDIMRVVIETMLGTKKYKEFCTKNNEFISGSYDGKAIIWKIKNTT